MNTFNRKTAIALAVASLIASPLAVAVDDPDTSADILHNHVVVEDWDISVDENRNTNTNTNTTTTTNDSTTTYTDTTTNTTNNTVNNTQDVTTSFTDTTTNNRTTDIDIDVNAVLDAQADIQFTGDYTDTRTNTEISNSYSENISSNISLEGNEHQTAVSLRKMLSLTSDINITGNPELTGTIDIDSAAIAVVDNQQSVSQNTGINDELENEASMSDDAAAGASGNLAFNVAAGDNNVQDNAAALSAADASFAFGMADAEVFVNQTSTINATTNIGVSNSASLSGNAFAGAAGNIGVNVTSGNNNAQKNALAASIATTSYAQSSVASNQVSNGNWTSNAGSFTTVENPIDFTLTGLITANGEGGSQATYSGMGAAYQMANFYPDTWADANHPNGDYIGHDDWDNETQGTTLNPYRNGVGGIAFDTDEEGIIDLSDIELVASLSGTLDGAYQVAVAATNTATLSGSAFAGASGNIGVNVSAGTNNLQANSLAMAVAQPSTGGGGGGGGE